MSEKIIVSNNFTNLIQDATQICGNNIVILSEQTVWDLYGEKFLSTVSEDKNIIQYIFPAGELAKNFKNYEQCLEFILQLGIHRNFKLLALGGGALSDVAGFVAATVVRGIPWSVIPTTLLSQVDACLGGKVAINSTAGKNLIGTFHRPQEIFLWPGFLASLSKEQMISGHGEILKYALLSKEIYQLVMSDVSLSEIIEACLQFKLDLVNQDPHDQNIRQYLNLGHTFGHAFEMNAAISHGEAVVLGIKTILEKFTPNLLPTFNQLCEKLSISINPKIASLPAEQFHKHLFNDKKRYNNQALKLVILKDIGQPEFLEWKG